jgi:hypothetical protein
MRTVTIATIPSSLDSAPHAAQAGRFARLVGIAIAALVPAIFWSVVIEIAAHWLGTSMSPVTVATVGATIALFLFAVCAPLMLRNSTHDRHEAVAGQTNSDE